MGSMLNQSDVMRLLKQPSPHVRATVAAKLALVMEGPGLSDHELDIAKDIIRQMAIDVEMVVRLAISKNLRHSQHLPHDVALKLANDVEAVALPILTDSSILTDDDLIDLVRASDIIKQKAIASRAQVSERLSDVIITTSPEAAVAVLMDNKGAQIGDKSLDKAVDRFAGSELVKERMVMRERLPAAVAERLAVMVSEKLQDHLIAHHDLSPALAEEIAVHGREMAVISMNRHTSPDDIEHLVREMERRARLTPTLILRALCAGNLTFFEFALAERARIPVTNASTLIHDPGEKALEALCEKAQVPAAYVPLIRIALHARQDLALAGSEDDLKRYRARIIERILTEATDMDEKDAEFFLDLVKSKPAYNYH